MEGDFLIPLFEFIVIYLNEIFDEYSFYTLSNDDNSIGNPIA
jgi:hypothetical protein